MLAMDSSAPRLSRSPALSLTTIAGKPVPTGDLAHAKTVGASLLAMESNAPRSSSSPALSLTTIAGKPAPTGDPAHAKTVGASLLAMDSSVPRPQFPLQRSFCLKQEFNESDACATTGRKSGATRPILWRRHSDYHCGGSIRRTTPGVRPGSCILRGCPSVRQSRVD